MLIAMLGMLVVAFLLLHQYGYPAMGGSARRERPREPDPPRPRQRFEIDLGQMDLVEVDGLYKALAGTQYADNVKRYLAQRKEEVAKEQTTRRRLVQQIDRLGFDPEKLSTRKLEEIIRELERR